MANHCIDVRCLRCDRYWCCRCGDTYCEGGKQISIKEAKKLMGDKRKMHNDPCFKCKTDELVVMD